MLTHQKVNMSKSMDEALERLAAKANTLNTRVSEANEIIEKANRALSAMNLGMEVWLMGVALGETSGQHEAPCIIQLGFAKVDGAWQLATREWTPDMEGEYGAPRVALIKQGRSVRIKASEHVQALIEQITREVDDALQPISNQKAPARAAP